MTENRISKYRSIGKVAELLDLKDDKGKPSTHTIRFWEKQFKQIKPKIFNGKRRYYDDKCIEILKQIKYMLKVKGMTIKGVKKALLYDNSPIDDHNYLSIKDKKNLKIKIQNLSNLIKNIKY